MQKLFVILFFIATLGFPGRACGKATDEAVIHQLEAQLRATGRALSLKLNFLTGSVIAVLLVVSAFAVYKMRTKQAIGRRKKIFSDIAVLIPYGFFILTYLGYAAYQTAPLYEYIKTRQRGWYGVVHRADPILGFAPIPNSRGANVFPIGPNIPTRYDENGFRVPMEDDVISHQRPLILALGCSFTYGNAVRAQDAFPYLVGQSLNGNSKNAGVCSYGLAQMLILAGRLVPTYEPDYLLVQYSDWLVDRAQSPFSQTYFGERPAPFFYMKNHRFALHPPVFLGKIMDLPIDRYQYKSRNWIDGLSFYLRVGLPLSIHDDFNMFRYISAKSIGLIPDPASSSDDLIRYVYRTIGGVAKEHGARTVVVILGNDATPVAVNEEWFPPDALVVDAQAALLRHLPVVDSPTYMEHYAHWRGTPPTLVDKHPNEKAHRIIADAIVSGITNNPSGQRSG